MILIKTSPPKSPSPLRGRGGLLTVRGCLDLFPYYFLKEDYSALTFLLAYSFAMIFSASLTSGSGQSNS